MIYRATLSLLSLAFCSNAFAAHIVTQTRSGTTLLHRTDTYANSAGDLRMEERSYGSSSTMADSASVGDPANIEYHLSNNVGDTTLFQANGQALVMLERNTCRRMTADSAPPPGLGVPGMNTGDTANQMADAMKQASSAFEKAMQQAQQEGMSAEQQRALEGFAKPFMEAPDIKPRDSLEIRRLNSRTQVGAYSAEGFLVSDLDGNEKHRIWVVPATSIDGGEDVRNAMQGMFEMYEQYVEKIGGGALMDTALETMFRKGELVDKYPVRIEDLESGEITEVIEAHSGGPAVEYYPDCEERDMFGF